MTMTVEVVMVAEVMEDQAMHKMTMDTKVADQMVTLN